METLAESEDDEGEMFLKNIDAEISHILDDDVVDIINVFSTLPSSAMLIADCRYVRYKIRSQHNQKFERTLTAVNVRVAFTKIHSFAMEIHHNLSGSLFTKDIKFYLKGSLCTPVLGPDLL